MMPTDSLLSPHSQTAKNRAGNRVLPASITPPSMGFVSHSSVQSGSLIIILLLTLGLQIMWAPIVQAGQARTLELPELGDYEIYSIGGPGRSSGKRVLLPESPRQALNEDGLIGYFSGATADKLPPKQLWAGLSYEYMQLTSRRGRAFRVAEDGHLGSVYLRANYIGDWAEWAVSIPFHEYSLAAPDTYGRPSDENVGVGNVKLGWKATYLPDRSYYRFGYGAVAYLTAGDPDIHLPITARSEDEVKVFGCVTTKETDRATANLELGTILNSRGHENRLVYRAGFSYQPTDPSVFICELSGEVLTGNDKDTMDLISGLRLAPARTVVFELTYTRNLRTYREYGFDHRFGAGATIRW